MEQKEAIKKFTQDGYKCLSDSWPPLHEICPESGYISKAAVFRVLPDDNLHVDEDFEPYIGVFFSENHEPAQIVAANWMAEDRTIVLDGCGKIQPSNIYWKEI